jgi:hypothetical protein
MNKQPTTIQTWLAQQGAGDIPLYRIARALGVKRWLAESLLAGTLTVESLLNLHTLAQYRHLALVQRLWPHCPWFEWQNRPYKVHATLDLIQRVFGYQLLDYVGKTFGEAAVQAYWVELEILSKYEDMVLDYKSGDPFAGVPDDQIVDNPHLDPDEEGGEFYVFGDVATAACFRWLIENRANYSHYVDNRIGYHHDPLGIRLAYDLRHVLQEEYWATLPPDTLPAYLAIARSLQRVTVPEQYQEGRLSPLSMVLVATLPTDRLEVVHLGDDKLWLNGSDRLLFDRQPISVFALESDSPDAPAALILTTSPDPGNPERHRFNPPLRYLYQGEETEMLALIPRDQVESIQDDITQVEEMMDATLSNDNYGLHEGTGIFCVCRYNPSTMGGTYGAPVPVYAIPGGYMLQFNLEYSFAPQEMAVE